ncbi:carbohydrate binding domain-containing protein [Corallincola spongiicola]|uniref:Uncharacterized protein n=1 Tax=Corallincola spongiicola TaxID=2520508 RepID=A0ABY1WLN2_9GAMM|nr:carbohydrate binding domain-containing protein [Corallincola spongiicola]TAA41834.1 hypothetical protein EXY25_16500 [Corallincola spongiicola]
MKRFYGKRAFLPTLGLCASALLATASASAYETVDVMVLYTAEAKAQQSGAINTYINHLISTTNTAYQTSGMDIRIRLVHSSEYNKSGATAMNADALNQLRLDSNVSNLRTQYGADIVTLLNLPSSNVCGLGYVGTGSNGRYNSYAKDWAYNMVGAHSNCGLLSFAHELGHNMGLGHSRKQNSLGGVFDYGTGYGVDSTFATIMAYPQSFGTYTQLRRFSDASVNDCRGYACGVDKNSANGAEAVDAINAVAVQLATWYPTTDDGGDNGGGDQGGDTGVIVEAEKATLFGLFKRGSDSAASGGQYIGTDYAGNYYDDSITAHRAELKVTLAESGIYQLKGTAYSVNSQADSLWIQVDNGTRHLWDTLGTATYEEMDVNSRGISETVEVDLSQGDHVITIYAREDGTRLDRLRLVRIGDSSGGGDSGGDNGGGDTGGEPTTITIEAEDAKLYGLFRRGDDNAASSGRYIDSLHQGLYYEGNALTANRAEITFNTTGAGRYMLKGTTYAPEKTADSFWIKVNDGDTHLWDTHNQAVYKEIDVNSRDVTEALEVELLSGQNTITVYVREDGSRLDQLRVIPIGGDSGGDNGGGTDEPQPETNLLQNGDLETGDTTGWVSGYTATTTITNTAYNSNYALVSENRTKWYHGPKQNITGIVTTGETYQLKSMVRMVSTSSAKIETRLLIQDGNGYTWHKLGQVSGTTDWQELAAEFTVQATGTLSKAELYFFGPDAGKAFIIDEVVLTQSSDNIPPTDPTDPDDGGDAGSVSAQLLAAVNEARSVGRNCGSTYYAATSPVQLHQSLQLAAEEHSNNMANNNFFSHTGLDGSDSNDRARRHGYSKTWAGENIGAGYGSVADVMNGWLNSEGHCRHIMNANHVDFGGARADNANSDYRSYWTLVLGY